MFYFDNAIGEANSWANNHTPYTYGSQHFLHAGCSQPPQPFRRRDRRPAVAQPFLGGKWFFFANYEGLRFPNAVVYSKNVPSAMLRAGVVQVADANGNYVPYNLNPNPVTVNGTTYAPAVCPAGACDPRNIGLNPIVNSIWSKQMPLPNNPLAGDSFNTQGFLGSIRAPDHQ